MNSFEGKNIVITGAGSGIGAALVSISVQAGANVWGLDISESAHEAVTERGGHYHRCDVSNECLS